MGRLILITEGGAHTVEYFIKNRVYPGAVVFEISKYREMLPYLSKDDEILVVINGLTDFTLAEVYILLKDIHENIDKIKNVTILSNVDLGKVKYTYYLYKGDLFYSKELYKVENGVIVKDMYEEKTSKKKKNGLIKNNMDVIKENGVVNEFKRYNNRNIKITIYGREKKESYLQEFVSDDSKYLDQVVFLNVFKDNK